MLAIFDMSSVNVTGYNYEIINKHSSKYIAYVDDPNLCMPINDVNCHLICTGWWRISKFVSHLRSNKISVIIISGQRPADLRILIAAAELNIPIIYKMHGLHIPYMKRTLIFYLDKFQKSIRTLFYLMDVFWTTRDLSLSIGMFRSFVFGQPRKIWANSPLLTVEIGLIWSEYWEDWHKDNWAMAPKSGWLTVGNPDTLKFKKINIKDDSIVYIYQTLVEDGRIDIKLMNDFYDSLQSLVKNTGQSVYVKWHPRGNIEIQKSLIERGFLICKDMPISKIYVGHYSSLLGLAPIMGGNVIIFELDGHVTPEPIYKIANAVVSNHNAFIEALKGLRISSSSKKSEAIYYFGNIFDSNIESRTINKLINTS